METVLRETHDAEQRHFWYRGFRRFVHPLLAVAAGAGPVRLLDAGCGTGANLALLSEFGQAWGFDLTLSGLVLGRARGAQVACATAAQMPFADGAFDVVTSFDVLYCLEEGTERVAVEEMFRVLRPGGAVLISVPAFDCLRGEHSVFVEERRRYTRARLRDLLGQTGFRIERLTCTNATLFVPLLVRRSWQRLRGLRHGRNARSDFRQPPAAVNGLLGALLAFEARIVERIDLPFGSTIVCLARKPGRTPSPTPHEPADRDRRRIRPQHLLPRL
jgi:SAM-dependent methyltransferase